MPINPLPPRGPIRPYPPMKATTPDSTQTTSTPQQSTDSTNTRKLSGNLTFTPATRANYKAPLPLTPKKPN